MSQPVDTSREAVEKIALSLDIAYQPATAALLRALLAERDAARTKHARDRISCVRKGYARGWREGIEAAAALHESINPASDMERLRGDPGAEPIGCPTPGACSAVAAYARGAADMRERAASLMATLGADEDHLLPEPLLRVRKHGRASRAAAIRALPLEPHK